MESFKVSNFRLRNVYGLPSVRGLFLFTILAAALWLSISQNSELERWIFLAMTLLILVHLSEASLPFRMMEIQILPLNPPFEGEPAAISVQIKNPTRLTLTKIRLRFAKSNSWLEIESIQANSAVTVPLHLDYKTAGKLEIPKLRVVNVPAPFFFRFWRIVNFKEVAYILPKPINRMPALAQPNSKFEDPELIGIDQIHDPRHLPMADQKLLLKTGIHYLRIYQSNTGTNQVELDWSKMKELGEREQGEQFSFWIKLITENPNSAGLTVSIKAPFTNLSTEFRSIDWRLLKFLFAEWLYANK